MVDKLSREALLERSLAASQTSNEHSRAVGQACILINGGAATAVIAFLAKDKLEASIFSQAAICLAGYAVGVFFATAMMFCATQSLDRWSLYWLSRVEGADTAANASTAKNWWWAYYLCSLATMGCFVGASVWLAKILYTMPIVTPLPLYQ